MALIGSNALPLNVGGLLLVLGGIGLLALETVVASYGLLTVGGVVAMVLGAFALWTGVSPGELELDVSVSPWLIAAVVAIGVVYAWVLVRALMQMRTGERHRQPAGRRPRRCRRDRPDPDRPDGDRLCWRRELVGAKSHRARSTPEPRCAWSGSKGSS